MVCLRLKLNLIKTNFLKHAVSPCKNLSAIKFFLKRFDTFFTWQYNSSQSVINESRAS